MDNISNLLSENVLTALVFSERGSTVIRGLVPTQAFSNAVYRRVAEAAFAFYDRHKVPPKDHIADELESELSGDDAQLYEDTLRGMGQLRENLNVEYVLGKLDDFNRANSLRRNITTAVNALEDGNLDAAEAAIAEYHADRRLTQTEGFSLAEAGSVLRNYAKRDIISIGIPAYDKSEVGLCRKELFLYGAPTKSGKSWFLTHIARRALMQHKKVLYITLEMSAPSIISRVLQNLFSLPVKEQTNIIIGDPPNRAVDKPTNTARRNRVQDDDTLGLEIIYPKMRTINGEAIFEVDALTVKRPSLYAPATVGWVEEQLRKLRYAPNFRVEERPTSSLTLAELEAIVDSLESTHRFVPDILVLDYADLMRIDTREYRINVGELFRRLRGFCGQRNIAMATATQLNRAALTLLRRSAGNVAEDFSKVFTSDTFLLYGQTDEEAAKGLARLSLNAARHGGFKRDVVISQCYDVGQFALQAFPMSNRYMKELREARKKSTGMGDDEEDDDI